MSPKSFCSVCGTEQGPFVSFLCKECYFKEKRPIPKLPRSISPELCTTCGAMRLGDLKQNIEGITPQEFLDIMWEWLRSTHQSDQLISVSYSHDFRAPTLQHKTPAFELITTWQFQPVPEFSEVELVFTHKVRIQKEPCSNCVQRVRRSSAAKVQVRRFGGGKLTSDEIERVMKVVSRIDPQLLRPNDEQSGLREKEGGVDIEVYRKPQAESIAYAIRDKMGADVSESRELAGRDKENLMQWRHTLSVKLTPLPVGTIFEEDELAYRVIGQSGRKAHIRNLHTGTTSWIDIFNSVVLRRDLGKSVVFREFLLLTVDDSGIAELMDINSNDYFTLNREQLPDDFEEGTELQGFIWNDMYFIL